jgi:hypothetical protein
LVSRFVPPPTQFFEQSFDRLHPSPGRLRRRGFMMQKGPADQILGAFAA